MCWYDTVYLGSQGFRVPFRDHKLLQEVAVAHMAQAGVVPITWVAVGAELQADWRNSTGQELNQIMGEHLPFYGNLFASFLAAKG
ncbi:hypothetical protein [Pseudomonas sp. 35 E 8]|uniref:hypothetical protein n=1 Tax=Pseudomonas sp. 35 E 8 TaxID=1844103 RepID=UPI000811E8BB|nr:hypothetical protein [Pseudomonas sp. 35 E 8]CRM18892.1 hypothetical protein [Pseudomonas sp. 35 E 8]